MAVNSRFSAVELSTLTISSSMLLRPVRGSSWSR